MSKKRAYQMTNLSMLLAERGFKIDDEDTYYLYASGKDYRVRADASRAVIEIGFSKTFDRWANSTDLTFDVSDWTNDKKLVRVLDEAAACVP
jgi:hypothetical protein